MTRGIFVFPYFLLQRFVWPTLGIFVSISALSLACLGQAPPAMDTYTASSSPSTNYGTSTILAVQNGVTSYVQFNLAGIPTTATVNKATLRLYVSAVTTAGSFDAFQVTRSWTEYGLKYSTAPTLGASATGGHPVAVTTAAATNFLVIDITSLVQGWLNGSKSNFGVALVVAGNLGGSFSFDSKESTTFSHQPELDVFFNGPAGPQGPQGPQGAQGLTGATGSQGPTGLTGAQGAQGLQGLTGSTGPQGPQGTNGVSFRFRNAFDNSLAYAINDVVTYSSSTYVAITASQGPNNPTPNVNTAGWSLMAQQGGTGPVGPPGSTGAAGAQGAPGPQGPVGATGQQGPIGLTGATGAQGPIGLTGATGTQGPIGLTGPQGSQGLIGPGGPQGIPGPPGANGVSFNFRNGFDNSLAYAVNDVVTYGGSTYVAITASQGPSNPTPDVNTAAWSLMAQQGSIGPQGLAGTTGPAGLQGMQGPQGVVGAAGPAGATGPQGPIGLTGPQGPQGAPGTNGANGSFNFTGPFNSATNYNVYDVVTYNGSTYDATAAIPSGAGTPDVNPSWAVLAQQGAAGLQGPIGVTGATGSQGPIGPQGPQGIPGTSNGTGGTGFNFTGTFNSATDYNTYDVVTYNGSTYDATVAIAQGGGTPDVNPNWALMAQQGASGAAGQQGPQGVPGPVGATGSQGPVGLTGPQGIPGANGTNGTGFNFTGPFNSTTNYNAYDVVTYNGSTYNTTVASAPGGGTPDVNPNWALMAQQGTSGQQGLTGATGATGPQGPIGLTGPQGPTGLDGPQGPIGLSGAQGPQGPSGTNGTNGTGFNFTGPFNSTTNYNAYDVVTYNGSTYDATVVIAPGGNNPDENPNWALMAQQGTAGATGPQGPQGNTGATGQAGLQGLTGAIGSQGPAGVTGPQGPIGMTGATGPQGPAGPSIPGVGSDGANGLTVQGNYTGGAGPTSINGLYQPTNTCPVATGMDWAICVGADHKLHCTNKDGSACQ